MARRYDPDHRRHDTFLQLRTVTAQSFDRCSKACHYHRSKLTDPEFDTLSEVIGAHNAGRQIPKGKLDHALGILGRFPDLAQGTRK